MAAAAVTTGPLSPPSLSPSSVVLTIRVDESGIWIGDGVATWTCDATEGIGPDGARYQLPRDAAPILFFDSDFIGVAQGGIPVVAALSSMLRAAMAHIGVATPADRVIAVCPTHWGAPRRAMLATATRAITGEVEVVSAAVCAGAARMARRGHMNGRSRCVVLEFNPLSVTACYVVHDSDGSRIEACEHAPNLSVAELGSQADGAAELGSLLAQVVSDRPPDSILVTGLAADERALVDSIIHDRYPTTTEIRHLDARDLVVMAERAPNVDIPVPTDVPLVAIDDQRARGAGAVFRRIAVPAVFVGLIATGVAVTWFQHSGRSADAQPKSDVASPMSAPAAKTGVGRVTVDVPKGWKVRQPIAGESADSFFLVPIDGSRRRIAVTQAALRGNPTLEQVRNDLSAQRAQPGRAGRYTDVTPKTVDGRAVLTFTEFVEDNSEVRHYVIVMHGTQVSVDCQYLAGEWGAIAGACERAVTTAEVGP